MWFRLRHLKRLIYFTIFRILHSIKHVFRPHAHNNCLISIIHKCFICVCAPSDCTALANFMMCCTDYITSRQQPRCTMPCVVDASPYGWMTGCIVSDARMGVRNACGLESQQRAVAGWLVGQWWWTNYRTRCVYIDYIPL